jgi:hypothetical protein
MLVLVTDINGVERAINLDRIDEFTAKQDEQNAQRYQVVFVKNNGEVIEANISEDAYRNMLNILQENKKIVLL